MTALHKIGAILRTYRKRQALTSSELAQRSGIHRNTLSALENGHGNVELNTLLSVCEQLDLDLSLVPSRVAAFVQAGGAMPSLPTIQREAFAQTASPAGIDESSGPRTALERRIVNRLSANTAGASNCLPGSQRVLLDTPGMEAERPGERPRIVQRVLNKSPLTAPKTTREAEPTALQRRIEARLAQTGTRKAKDRK